jgi:hypothetical protein
MPRARAGSDARPEHDCAEDCGGDDSRGDDVRDSVAPVEVEGRGAGAEPDPVTDAEPERRDEVSDRLGNDQSNACDLAAPIILPRFVLHATEIEWADVARNGAGNLRPRPPVEKCAL